MWYLLKSFVFFFHSRACILCAPSTNWLAVRSTRNLIEFHSAKYRFQGVIDSRSAEIYTINIWKKDNIEQKESSRLTEMDGIDPDFMREKRN